MRDTEEQAALALAACEADLAKAMDRNELERAEAHRRLAEWQEGIQRAVQEAKDTQARCDAEVRESPPSRRIPPPACPSLGVSSSLRGLCPACPLPCVSSTQRVLHPACAPLSVSSTLVSVRPPQLAANDRARRLVSEPAQSAPGGL